MKPLNLDAIEAEVPAPKDATAVHMGLAVSPAEAATMAQRVSSPPPGPDEPSPASGTHRGPMALDIPVAVGGLALLIGLWLLRRREIGTAEVHARGRDKASAVEEVEPPSADALAEPPPSEEKEPRTSSSGGQDDG